MFLAIVTSLVCFAGMIYCLSGTIKAHRRNTRTHLLWLVPLTLGFAMLVLSSAAIAWRTANGPTWLPLPASLLSLAGGLALMFGVNRLKRYRDVSARR